ncbi:hypothetical protein I4U23_019390 [Adineta vaga]|nr:hypothetical protein I4U23_019390 [Adineta vaga]
MNNTMPTSSSSNRSSRMPLSFDRFRVRSISFLSPFRNHSSGRRSRHNPERLWTCKTQVHPHNDNTSVSKQSHRNCEKLFNVNKQSNDLQLRKSRSVCCIEPCSTFDMKVSQSKIEDNSYPTTQHILRYRNVSLPTIKPVHFLPYPKSFSKSIEKFDFK